MIGRTKHHSESDERMDSLIIEDVPTSLFNSLSNNGEDVEKEASPTWNQSSNTRIIQGDHLKRGVEEEEEQEQEKVLSFANIGTQAKTRTCSAIRKKSNFPEELMDMLSSEDNSDAVGWTSKGDMFQILKKDVFETSILPRYFNQQTTKINSFQRKLKRWGFKLVRRGVFCHQYFQRNRRDLLHLVTHDENATTTTITKPAQTASTHHQDKKEEISIDTSNFKCLDLTKRTANDSLLHSLAAASVTELQIQPKQNYQHVETLNSLLPSWPPSCQNDSMSLPSSSAPLFKSCLDDDESRNTQQLMQIIMKQRRQIEFQKKVISVQGRVLKERVNSNSKHSNGSTTTSATDTEASTKSDTRLPCIIRTNVSTGTSGGTKRKIGFEDNVSGIHKDQLQHIVSALTPLRTRSNGSEETNSTMPITYHNNDNNFTSKERFLLSLEQEGGYTSCVSSSNYSEEEEKEVLVEKKRQRKREQQQQQQQKTGDVLMFEPSSSRRRPCTTKLEESYNSSDGISITSADWQQTTNLAGYKVGDGKEIFTAITRKVHRHIDTDNSGGGGNCEDGNSSTADFSW